MSHAQNLREYSMQNSFIFYALFVNHFLVDNGLENKAEESMRCVSFNPIKSFKSTIEY